MRKEPRRPGGAGVLARALGVTRVARLTGLDRTGVEVASAVRPGGHVLQVTNGKGLRFEEAARGALLEAAELWAVERPAPGDPAPRCSAAELRAGAAPGERVLAPEGEEPDGLRRAWLPARPLDGRGRAWVAADAVRCPPAGGPLDPAWARWTSNGMGAHPSRPAALRHALLEAIERDQLARALPEGFTEGQAARRLVDPATLAAAAPGTAALRASLEERGFRVHLLDLSPTRGAAARRGRRSAGPEPLDLGLPVAAAVIVDEEGGPVPAAAGYACRLTRDGALLAALLEAAQSRATEIHGAREDVAWGDRGAAAPLAALLAGVPARRPAAALPTLRAAGDADACRQLAGRLARAGLRDGAAVDLPAPGGVRVVKVIVPGLLLSELLC
jgi:ribosomal protein S12 methylthiotransferase accessory factor